MFSEFFNYDNMVWRFFGKLWDVLILNLLWLLLCIPVFTAGAATTALYYVTLKMAGDSDSYIIRAFFRSFRQNFKQATAIWLPMLAAGLLLWFDIRFFVSPAYMQGPLRLILLYLSMVLGILYLCVLTYVFPLQSRFVNPVARTFQNALLMAVRHLPTTLLLLAVDGGLIYLMLFHFQWLLLWGFGLIAFLNSFLFHRIFMAYMPDKGTDEDTIFRDEEHQNPTP